MPQVVTQPVSYSGHTITFHYSHYSVRAAAVYTLTINAKITNLLGTYTATTSWQLNALVPPCIDSRELIDYSDHTYFASDGSNTQVV